MKATVPHLPAAEVTGSDFRQLRSTLERSSSSLEARFENGLKSLGARVGRLEDERAREALARRASSQPKVDAPEAVVAVAVPAPHAEDDEDALTKQRRAEEMLATMALTDEIPLVKRHLEAVDVRVAALEAAPKPDPLAGTADAPPGLSPEDAANAIAAADAAREAAEDTQSRMIAEMSALEERIDRRAREEARKAREEREAADARASMRRVSSTVSAYTADLATRLEGVRSDQSLQGAEVARAAEEIAAAEAELRSLGSELVGLGQVANNVSWLDWARGEWGGWGALSLCMAAVV